MCQLEQPDKANTLSFIQTPCTSHVEFHNRVCLISLRCGRVIFVAAQRSWSLANRFRVSGLGFRHWPFLSQLAQDKPSECTRGFAVLTGYIDTDILMRAHTQTHALPRPHRHECHPDSSAVLLCAEVELKQYNQVRHCRYPGFLYSP